jgi:anti-sigma factor RsiW
MNCGAFEPLIALYVEGDLPEQETRRVEEHLAACLGCRELLEDLRASQAVVKQLGSESVDPALLATVRSGVLARIDQPGPWLWRRWRAVLAAALALIAMFVLALRKPAPAPPAVPIAQAPPKPEEPKIEVASATPSPRPAHRRTHRPRRSVAGKTDQPLVVKMLTDDPNIVIIWLVDQPGD